MAPVFVGGRVGRAGRVGRVGRGRTRSDASPESGVRQSTMRRRPPTARGPGSPCSRGRSAGRKNELRPVLTHPLGDPGHTRWVIRAEAGRWRPDDPRGALALPNWGGSCGGAGMKGYRRGGCLLRRVAPAALLVVTLALVSTAVLGAATASKAAAASNSGAGTGRERLPGHQGLVPPGATLIGPAPAGTALPLIVTLKPRDPQRWRPRCRRSPTLVRRSTTAS